MPLYSGFLFFPLSVGGDGNLPDPGTLRETTAVERHWARAGGIGKGQGVGRGGIWRLGSDKITLAQGGFACSGTGGAEFEQAGGGRKR